MYYTFPYRSMRMVTSLCETAHYLSTLSSSTAAPPPHKCRTTDISFDMDGVAEFSEMSAVYVISTGTSVCSFSFEIPVLDVGCSQIHPVLL